jgi:hypothetical protein
LDVRKIKGRVVRNVWFWEEGADRLKYPYFEPALDPGYRPPPWRRTTPEDVARLLAEAEMAPSIESLPTERQRAQRRAELAPLMRQKAARIFALLGPCHHLLMMAIGIDRQRALYEARIKAEQDCRRNRRQMRDAITTLKRLLPAEIETFEHLERSYLTKSAAARASEAWHECARKLAAEYVINLAPTVGWARDAVSVCFIEQALKWIGIPAGEKFTRTAIARIIVRAF